MLGFKKLQPHSEYEVYVVNPITTKFGVSYVIFDHVHKQHFIVPTKVKKYIEANKINEIAEDGTCLFKIKTRDYKTFVTDNKKITYLDLSILK